MPMGNERFLDTPTTRAVLLNSDEVRFTIENLKERRVEILSEIVNSAEAHDFEEVSRFSTYLAKLEALIKKLEG